MELSGGMQSLISGALYDFASYLTSRPTVLKAGASEPVYDVLEALQKWAAERQFEIENVDADLDWNKSASAPTLADLAGSRDEEVRRIASALREFAKFCEEESPSSLDQALLRFASKKNLCIANPQIHWRAHWWG